MQSTTDPIAAIERAGLARIPVRSGLGKLAVPEATQADLASERLPLPSIAYAVAIQIEVASRLALLPGFRSHAMAVALALSMSLPQQAFTPASGIRTRGSIT